jgi:hypothetical protein
VKQSCFTWYLYKKPLDVLLTKILKSTKPRNSIKKTNIYGNFSRLWGGGEW